MREFVFLRSLPIVKIVTLSLYILFLFLHYFERYLEDIGGTTEIYIDLEVDVAVSVIAISLLIFFFTLNIKKFLALFVSILLITTVSTRVLIFSWESLSISQKFLIFNDTPFRVGEGEYCLHKGLILSYIGPESKRYVILTGVWPIHFDKAKLENIAQICRSISSKPNN